MSQKRKMELHLTEGDDFECEDGDFFDAVFSALETAEVHAYVAEAPRKKEAVRGRTRKPVGPLDGRNTPGHLRLGDPSFTLRDLLVAAGSLDPIVSSVSYTQAPEYTRGLCELIGRALVDFSRLSPGIDYGTGELALEVHEWLLGAGMQQVEGQPPEPPTEELARLRLALRKIRDARDFHAEHGSYPEQANICGRPFEDWAADVACVALDEDPRRSRVYG